MFKDELKGQYKRAKRYMDKVGEVIYHDFYTVLRKKSNPNEAMVLKGISFSDIVGFH